jgi:hypothetical protein
LNVAKLESFKGQTPYELHDDGQSTRLKFIRSDPLPLVSVRVNFGEEVTFFIDTGGSEVTLDTEFAKELGLPQFGDVQGTFSGGEHTQVQQSRIQSLTLGDWTVTNLPIAAIPLRQLSQGLGAKRIDGVLGTTLFYHFQSLLGGWRSREAEDRALHCVPTFLWRPPGTQRPRSLRRTVPVGT